MKKISCGFICAICACTFVFAGCTKENIEGNSSTGGAETAEKVVVNITDSSLVMDCFDGYRLDVELTNTESVVWSSSAPDIVSVDGEGVLTSHADTGTATITAKSGNISDTCEVSVVVKNGLPVLNVADRIAVPRGGIYTVSATVFYNGKDITDYVVFGFNAVDDAQQIVEAEMADGGVITFTGVSDISGSGNKTEYIVYATVFGQLYAEKVEIEVKNTDVVYLVNGAVGNELQLKKGVKASTADVEIYDKSIRVPDAALNWEIEDETVATIGDDGTLIAGREGVTNLSTVYEGEKISVSVRVIKEHEYIETKNCPDIDLDLEIGSADSGNGVRTYKANETQTSQILLSEEEKNCGKITGVFCDGESLDADKFSMENGTITVYVSAFGTERYGEKKLVVETETEEVIYVFSVRVLLVTKFVSTKAELEKAIVVSKPGEIIYGYYALKQDIECAGYAMQSVWATDWNYDHGFRGTLDGRGFAVNRCETSMYGLTAQIGRGAVIKNIRFEEVGHTGGVNTLLARGMGGATVENVTVTLSEASTPDRGEAQNSGLLAYASVGNVYRNVTIDATGKNIFCLFGKELDTADSVYENVVVYASGITYYSREITQKPEGVVLNTEN